MLLAIILEPIGLLLLAAVAWWIYKSKKNNEKEQELRAKQIESSEKFCDAVGKLTEATKALQDAPKFMDGTLKLCTALVAEVGKFRMATQRFQNLIVRPEEAKNALSNSNEEDASLAFEVANLLASNPDLAVEEAAERAKNEMERKALYSSVSLE